MWALVRVQRQVGVPILRQESQHWLIDPTLDDEDSPLVRERD